MQNVILIVHLILALCLIGAVLMQRSEGGGLGMGGGGGGSGGLVSSRGAATALGKLTWGFAIGFIITSITLTILAAQNAGSASVLDTLGIEGAGSEGLGDGVIPSGESLLPPVPTETEDSGDTGPRAD